MDKQIQPNFEIIRLAGENDLAGKVTKVGILPFVKEGGIRSLFMRPRATARHLGTPAFQIAKGTRRVRVSGDWCDMREDDLRHADESFHETLLATALREGAEEVGLKPENIARLYDLGGFTFRSARSGIPRPMALFAAEVKDESDFSPFDPTTAETRWLTEDEFAELGRPDHYVVLKDALKML